MNAAPPMTLEERLTGKGSPFELVNGEFRNSPASLADLYAKSRLSGSQILISHGDTALTFREVFQRAECLARRMVAQFGVASGQNVAIVLPNGPEWLIAFVAITSIGASAVVVHRDSGDASITRAIARSRCALVITEERLVSMLACASSKILAYSSKQPEADSQVARATAFASPDPDSVAVIAHTSGSTGEPKQVRLSHRALLHGLMNTMLASALSALRNRQGRTSRGATPVSLLVAPFSHVSGYMHFLAMLRVGGTIITTVPTDARGTADLVAEKSASSLVGAQPNAILELIRDPELVRKLGSLRSLGVQGTHLSGALLAEVSAALPQLTVGSGYGLTETNGLIALAAGSELATRPHSCGRVIPSVEVRIVDDNGSQVPESMVGEIWVRGRMLASSYVDDVAANSAAFRDGWFCTGDAGRMDHAGFLYVLGRANRGRDGWRDRATLAKLEHLALAADFVDEATAMELQIGPGETRTIVAVVRRAGCDLDLEDLKHRVRLHAGHSASVIEMPGLPRTSTGKIDRSALLGVIDSQHAFC